MGISRRKFIVSAAGAGLVLLSNPLPKIIPAWGTSLALGAGIKYVSNRTSSGGNGTMSNPYQVREIWQDALPGDEFVFLDGTYKGANSMLDVAYGGGEGKSGTAEAWIKLRAETDGGVTFDGEGNVCPIRLAANKYIIVQGFNACNSRDGAVVSATKFSGGTNTPCQWIQFRRICGWDAPINTNHHVFTVVKASNVLFEDCAGWGGGRKIFEIFDGGSGTSGGYGGGGVTLRRCWGEWNGFGPTGFGPHHTFSLSYWYTNVIGENLIGTWDLEPDKVVSNSQRDIFGHDGHEALRYVKLLGSIAYAKQNQTFTPSSLIEFYGFMGETEIRDTVAIIESGSRYTDRRPFSLLAGTYATTNSVRDSTAKGNGTLSSIHSSWTKTNFVESNQLLGSLTGMKRYVNGVKTSTDLFPWPMNQRIIDARVQSGRSAVDVTATMGKLENPDLAAPQAPRGLSVK